MVREIRCSQCGAKCFDGDSYCPKCHATISEKDKKDESVLEGIEIEVWKQCIGNGANEYVEIFKKHEGKKFFISFNSAACFFGTTWMLHRGMFVFANITTAAALLLLLLWAYITSVSSPLMLLAFPMIFMFGLAMGLFSNCVYKNYVKRRILKNKNNPQKNRLAYTLSIIATVVIWLAVAFLVEPFIAHLLLKI